MGLLQRPLALAILLLTLKSLEQHTLARREDGLREPPEEFEPPAFSCELQGQFPYMVSVRDGSSDRDHLCGGIVIASNAVLTAAHCLDSRVTTSATITPDLHIGSSTADSAIEIRRTVRAFPHPEWRGNTLAGNDLIILKLDQETCVRPVHQLGADDAEDRRDRPDLLFLGYGRHGAGGSYSYQLNAALMNTLNATYCAERYDVDGLSDGDLCARGRTTVGICTGDFGGPLILTPSQRQYADVLVGIASYATASCNDAEGTSVMMDIRAYRDWINETLESEEFINA